MIWHVYAAAVFFFINSFFAYFSARNRYVVPFVLNAFAMVFNFFAFFLQIYIANGGLHG